MRLLVLFTRKMQTITGCSVLMCVGPSIVPLVKPYFFYRSEYIHTLTWECVHRPF